MGVPRQECWSGLPFSSPRDLPDPGINPHLLHWQVDSLPLATRKAHLTHHYRRARLPISPPFCQHRLLSILFTLAILACGKRLSLLSICSSLTAHVIDWASACLLYPSLLRLSFLFWGPHHTACGILVPRMPQTEGRHSAVTVQSANP